MPLCASLSTTGVRFLGALAAGSRGVAVAPGVERVAAGTALDGIRVVDIEPSTHQRVYVVDLRAGQVHGAHLVDADAHAILLDDLVAFLHVVVKCHAIAHPGTAAG